MGSSGSAAVYCLKKFKKNYLKYKAQIDEELRDEYDIEMDLGDITDLSVKEIGDKLCISTRTVEKHRKRIMEKTASKNFIGVVLFALKTNAISLNDFQCFKTSL